MLPSISFLLLRPLLLALLLLAGCESETTAALPTTTAVRVVQASLPAETPRALNPVATAPVAQTSPEPAVTPDCPPAAGSSPVIHTVEAVVNYPERSAEVAHQISYRNESSQPTDTIGLTVEPNRWPNAFTLERVLIGGQPAPAYELESRRLIITLSEPLAPGCTAILELHYRIVPPLLGEGAAALTGFFSIAPRQMNLGDWLPTLAVRRNSEWVTNEVGIVGEQSLAAPADWDVLLRVYDAPGDLRLAAPGDVTPVGDHAWHIQLPAARDFSISLSEYFEPPLTRRVNGVTVELYALEDRPAAAHALNTAANALVLFEDLFGDYPYNRFVVVEGDFPDGMEHTGLVFVGTYWFNTYADDPAGYLTLITAHETAHQWWYGLVGNDAATDPWLDEALSTYSELVFLEEYYPDLRDWWWDFRVRSFVGGDGPYLTTDQPVYAFATAREYINSVYLRGAEMLQDARDILGADEFFAWLRAYADTNRGRLARPQSLWSLLTPAQLAATSPARAAYLAGNYDAPEPTPDSRDG